MTEDTIITKLALIKYAVGLSVTELLALNRRIRVLLESTKDEEIIILKSWDMQELPLQLFYDHAYEDPKWSRPLTILCRVGTHTYFGYFNPDQLLRPLDKLLKNRLKAAIKNQPGRKKG
jgi:hypothetical protein